MTRRIPTAWKLLATLLLVAPLASFAAKPGPSTSSLPLHVHVYTQIVDEHDTNAYFNDPQSCPFGPWTSPTNLLPDTLTGPTKAWNLGGWVPVDAVSGTYTHGVDALRAEFSTSYKVFSLDTRLTTAPRRLTVDFGDPQGGSPRPPFLPADTSITTHSTTGLLQVSGTSAYTSMGVCSSDACPEAREINAKFWFNDPTQSDVMWRIDWPALRVLRVSDTTWYFIGSACGGSQLAGLSKLQGNRTKPRETLNGHFLIPVFFAAELK